jgi:hypothetical protein
MRSAVDDLLIEALASDEAAALERILELEYDNGVLRDMVRESLRQLAITTAHLDAARAAIHALRGAERRAAASAHTPVAA